MKFIRWEIPIQTDRPKQSGAMFWIIGGLSASVVGFMLILSMVPRQ